MPAPSGIRYYRTRKREMKIHTDFFDNGFTDLIPIRHGDKRPAGKWTEVRASREDVERWQSGNLGLRTARFPCVDIDVKDADLAERLEILTVGVLGEVPVRKGLFPKRALFYRADVPFRKRWVQFERGDESYRVEILAAGQYAVIAGLHPSGTAYEWSSVPVAADLPVITEAQADDLLERVTVLVEAEGWLVVGKRDGASDISAPEVQASLAGPREEVEAAVRALPNTSALFPSREDYLRLGVAIKASLPDDPEGAFALFLDWCSRWTDGHNDPALVRRDWDSLRPPFRVGWGFLSDLAQQHGGISTAADDFREMPLEDAPLEETDPPFSHAWLANRFRAAHGARVRWCESYGGWLRWDGARWAPDSTKTVREWASRVCREAGDIAGTFGLTAQDIKVNRRYAASVGAIDSTLEYVSHHPEIATPVDAFDANPWLLNTPGGVVDLRTGAVIPNDPAYLFTRQTAVAPRPMDTPKWDAFLEEVTGGDAGLRDYLHRLVGYCLTGSTREHVLAFLYGGGGNGKGVFLNTVTRALGTYATVAAMDTFTASRGDKHPTDLAALAGSRLVTAQETQEGRSWDEAKVKSITGGDPISARFMRQDFFTYLPQFKILFAGNHKPRLHNVDAAMKRRFHLVPFTVTPRQVNKNLSDDLIAELPGILQWAISGCLAWQAEGLNPPRAVLAATESYFLEEDAVGRWTLERLDPSPKVTATKDLYADWCAWCVESGETPGTMRALTAALRGRGIEEGRTASARGFALTIRANVATEFTEAPVELDDLIPMGRRA